MAEWINFLFYAVKEIVKMVFSWNIGLGFSLGDFFVAVSVVSIVVSALLIKSAHIGGGRIDFEIKGGTRNND